MYNGEYSVTFRSVDGGNEKNTWTDWFLIPTSRPVVKIPKANTRFVEIPGMNGSYDITDYLTSGTIYTDQSGEFEFLVDNDHADWTVIYSEILKSINGQRLRMTLSDDPGWYYEGRFAVNEFKSDNENSRIVISYRVSPHQVQTQNS